MLPVSGFPSSDSRQHTQRYQGRLYPAVIRDTCCCLVAPEVITATEKNTSQNLSTSCANSQLHSCLARSHWQRFRCAQLSGASDSRRGERNISRVGANIPLFSCASSETTATGVYGLTSKPSSRSILSELSGLCALGEIQSKLVGKGSCSMDC
jgi:hypothetical protein